MATKAKKVDPRMVKARSNLILRHPFYGTLALYLVLVEDESVETMATDGEHLFYAPTFLSTITGDELEGVVAHEVTHNAYRHHTRRKLRDPQLWNEAADYAINRDLIRAGFKLPKEALIDKQYDGMSTEEIYERLLNKSGGRGGKGAGGAGQGGTVIVDIGRCGKVIDAAQTYDVAKNTEMEAEWDRRVRQAINVATKIAGSLPGHLERLAGEIKAPKVDWREELRRFIDMRCSHDYTWMRPNKRFIGQGLVMPSIYSEGISKIGIVVDTSGSIDDELLGKFTGEIQAAMDEGAVEEVVTIYCDTRVSSFEKFRKGDFIKLNATGGGGTEFDPAFRWFDEHEPDCAAIIFFTDLCPNSGFGNPPGADVIWVGYGYESFLNEQAKKVPFGEVIKVLD